MAESIGTRKRRPHRRRAQKQIAEPRTRASAYARAWPPAARTRGSRRRRRVADDRIHGSGRPADHEVTRSVADGDGRAVALAQRLELVRRKSEHRGEPRRDIDRLVHAARAGLGQRDGVARHRSLPPPRTRRSRRPSSRRPATGGGKRVRDLGVDRELARRERRLRDAVARDGVVVELIGRRVRCGKRAHPGVTRIGRQRFQPRHVRHPLGALTAEYRDPPQAAGHASWSSSSRSSVTASRSALPPGLKPRVTNAACVAMAASRQSDARTPPRTRKPLRLRCANARASRPAAPQEIRIGHVRDQREQRLHGRALAILRGAKRGAVRRQREAAHGTVAARRLLARAAAP